jgi:hypothetical protein
MFRLASQFIVRRWPLTIGVPRDGGTVEELSDPDNLTVDLKLWVPNSASAVIHDVLKAHVIGWSGISAEDGSELPFSAENLDMALRLSFLRQALWRALLEASNGDAARKNSPAGSAG